MSEYYHRSEPEFRKTPKVMIRPDDKEEFILNEETNKYFSKTSLENFPDHWHPSWTYEVLIRCGFYEKH